MAEAGVAQTVIAYAAEDEQLCRAATEAWPVRLVVGGATRTQSVRAALDAVGAANAVLIHDAARPGLTPHTIKRLLAALDHADGAAPALPVADSLRRAAEGFVTGEVDRDGLVAVQTPQAFRLPVIRAAYAADAGGSYSDDIAIARAAGARIALIPGEARLMKLTYPADFAVLERLMDAQIICVGTGYDAHRFGEGDHIMLCGVRIAHDKGLIGHSDADAAWHALVDAILGALGAGDIGVHFPPSDARWKGAASEAFLRRAVEMAAQQGARIMHADITLICERPRIGPHREAMRARTAETLGLPLERISVKATTTERMGFTGREEGLAAMATATLARPG